MPQEHTVCGICGAHFMLCGCEGLPYACNYILVGLPAPASDSTPLQLLKRWASLVSMSMSMGAFAANEWLADNGQTLLASIRERATLLDNMVDDYIASLPSDPSKISPLAQAVGGTVLKDKPVADQVAVVASETKAAMAAFQSGDWACITFVGSILIQNSFQASDPQKYPLNDVHLNTVFQNGVGLLNSILDMGYDPHGWHLAMENERAPVGTTGQPLLASAASHLQDYRS